jgi:hypothetical protein
MVLETLDSSPSIYLTRLVARENSIIILTDVFLCFPQCVQTNSGIEISNKSQSPPFISLPVTHS